MQKLWRPGLVAAVLAITPLAFPAAAQRANPAAFPLEVEPLDSPARPDSGEPQLTVSDRGVILSWVERDGPLATLKFAERTASGWSVPRQVASGEDWFVNWADVPSVIRLDDGTLAAHWLEKSGPGTYAYDVRLSHSTDDGRTWADPFTPHHDGTQTEHGFASLFQRPGAGLGLVWLDGRQMAGGDEGSGAMTLRSASFDRRWRQTSETPIDLRVCECCPTTAVETADGILVAYRNRGEDETRDIYVSRLEDGAWTEGRAVHDDGWRINACPVNGPMLSARGRDVAIAWFHARDGDGHVFVAFSEDAGRTFGAPIRLDDHAAYGRVDLELLAGGSALATWIEYTEGRADLRVRLVDRTGARSDAVSVTPLMSSRASGYPRVALHDGELTFAWTDRVTSSSAGGPGTLRVAAARARLPQGGSR